MRNIRVYESFHNEYFHFLAEKVSGRKNNFYSAYSRKNSLRCETSCKGGKLAFSDPEKTCMSLKPNIESSKKGSSDHLLVVNVKVLLKLQGKVVQMDIENSRIFRE